MTDTLCTLVMNDIHLPNAWIQRLFPSLGLDPVLQRNPFVSVTVTILGKIRIRYLIEVSGGFHDSQLCTL